MLLLLCTFFSCEKPSFDSDVESQMVGNLTVSVNQIERTPFSSFTRATVPVAEVCTRLNYAIYDMGGTRVKQVNQVAGDANFGTTGFQLEEGTYQLVVVGHSSSGNPTMTDPTAIKFTNANGFTDTFLYNENITIGEEPIDKQITLNRIVALCRVVITDDFPSEVKKMRFYYTGGSGAFDAATGLGSVNSKQDVKVDVDGSQKQFDLYTFLHDTEGTIHLTVTALDANGSELYHREFDVPMEQNYISWLTGAFFAEGGSSSSASISITANTDWAGDKHFTF